MCCWVGFHTQLPILEAVHLTASYANLVYTNSDAHESEVTHFFSLGF